MKDGVPVYRGDVQDTDAHAGFGAALEAAITGHSPGSTPAPENYPQHSATETRFFEEVVNSYGEMGAKDQGNAIPQNMRQNLANAVAYHPSDVYAIPWKNVDFSDPDSSTEPNDVDLQPAHPWGMSAFAPMARTTHGGLCSGRSTTACPRGPREGKVDRGLGVLGPLGPAGVLTPGDTAGMRALHSRPPSCRRRAPRLRRRGAPPRIGVRHHGRHRHPRGPGTTDAACRVGWPFQPTPRPSSSSRASRAPVEPRPAGRRWARQGLYSDFRLVTWPAPSKTRSYPMPS